MEKNEHVEGQSIAPDLNYWRELYMERRNVISGWHARAVAMGYDGVESILDDLEQEL